MVTTAAVIRRRGRSSWVDNTVCWGRWWRWTIVPFNMTFVGTVRHAFY
jgi:hypothetical protein